MSMATLCVSLNSLSLLHFHNSPLSTVRYCSSSSSSPSSGKSKPCRVSLNSLSLLHFHNSPLSTVRYCSSSSSSSPSSGKSKPDKKKLGDRLLFVIDAVNDRKLPPELRGQGNNVRSETDLINVVEQRIWHSMEDGQFENLPGKGKPLKLDTNPHADPAEDTLYRILSKNGCSPEWVELNKEIRSRISVWKISLKKAWANKCSGDHSMWVECSEVLKSQLKEINDKVSWLCHSFHVNVCRKLNTLNMVLASLEFCLRCL